MNERIRELVKQAGGEFWQRLENDVVNPEAFVTFDPPQSLEKFVELIVDAVYDYILNATFDDEPWPDRKDVKKHFGVEDCEDEYDGQPDEAQEWHDFDPDC